MHYQQLFATLALAAPLVAAAGYSSQLGCFTQVPSLTQVESYEFQNNGYCRNKCAGANYLYAALKDDDCGCSNSAPTSESQISTAKCSTRCSGYPTDMCGGQDSWTVIRAMDDADSSEDDDDIVTSAANVGIADPITASAPAASASESSAPSSTPTIIGPMKTATDVAEATTTNGIIVPVSVSPDSIPTGILTAASSAGKHTTTDAASSTMVTATKATATTSSSASASPTSTGNAAGALRAAPVAGVLAAGVALLL
ncbi:hypothetical protein N7468_009323 [Penicillium chermesinum]|uniref:WSC domain-containing protein n=1 Tax=Penicillium chermesinum TaxID=63820 RepID=A0A9W9NK22_9EURO|nr:uncharacterized protein N7468_009323 [Penicillium chermesinum]KAJ5220119.1 hypothetical protein N7468_009323 [Penicillium chermesinum]